jgi:hypothetical protein
VIDTAPRFWTTFVRASQIPKTMLPYESLETSTGSSNSPRSAIPVPQFSDVAENRSKFAHVRAISYQRMGDDREQGVTNDRIDSGAISDGATGR